MKWAGVSLSCLVCAAAACAACGPSPPRQAPAAASTAASPAATPVVVQAAGGVQPGSRPAGGSAPQPVQAARPVASPSPAALPLSVLAGRSGADVRVALNVLFQEQRYLSAAAVDAAASGRLDELIGVSGALDQNALALAEIVGAVKGQLAAGVLLDAWRGLTADLVGYAQGDQARARADLEQRRPVIAAQLALGSLVQTVVDDLLGAHIETQLRVADAIIIHDPTQTAERLRLATPASDELARRLAAAISASLPTAAPPPTEGLDVELRIGLTRLLQEHTYLSGAAIAAAADGRSSELKALLAAADQNASDAGAQLSEVYGQQVGDGVAERLRAETAVLVSVGSGGDRAQAATDLARIRGELDSLLSTANQLLPPGLVGQELRASSQPLLTAADAFSARDFGTAFSRLRESARQSRKFADSLALSLVDRYPGRYFAVPTSTPHP